MPVTQANPFGCALVKLPKLPSDLIRLALKDLALIERSKIYDLDMGEWHTTGEDEERGVTCAVCFAGAVMARTLKAPINKSMGPEHVSFPSYNQKRLMALDEFRGGCIQTGLQTISNKFSQTYLMNKHDGIFCKIENLSEALDYHADPAGFKRTMRKIANLFEKMGL